MLTQRTIQMIFNRSFFCYGQKWESIHMLFNRWMVHCYSYIDHRKLLNNLFKMNSWFVGSPGDTSGKETACQCWRHGFDPWVRKIPWRRARQPTWVFLPGQRCLVGYSPWGSRVRQHWSDLAAAALIYTTTWNLNDFPGNYAKKASSPKLQTTWFRLYNIFEVAKFGGKQTD